MVMSYLDDVEKNPINREKMATEKQRFNDLIQSADEKRKWEESAKREATFETLTPTEQLKRLLYHYKYDSNFDDRIIPYLTEKGYQLFLEFQRKVRDIEWAKERSKDDKDYINELNKERIILERQILAEIKPELVKQSFDKLKSELNEGNPLIQKINNSPVLEETKGKTL